MTKSKHTKRALLASGLSMLLSVAMLAGSTFAWFTDSVTSGKNIITAGNLDISATVHELEEWASNGGHVTNGNFFTIGTDFLQKEELGNRINLGFSLEGLDLEGNADFMSDSLFEPGKSYIKLITVKNDGNLAAKVRLHFNVQDGGLQEALWFALSAETNATMLDAPSALVNRTPMSKLNESLDFELPLLEKNDEINIIFAYGMNEEAGNEFKNKSFSAELQILATQYTHEEDAFGPDYDADAKYDHHFVTNETELNAALSEAAENDVIQLTDNVVLSGELNLNKAVTLDLGGKVLEGRLKTTAPAGTGKVVVKNGTLKSTGTGSAVSVFADSEYAQEQIFENLTIEALSVSDRNYAFKVFNAAEGSRITVSNCTITSAGGGLSLQASAEYVFDKLTIKAGDSRALYAGSGSGVYTLSGLNLSNNSATKATVDITGTMLLENCRVENAAENGKAIKLVKTGVNNTISGDDTSITGKLDISSNVSFQISGGIFSEEPAAKYLAAGMQVYLQDDGTFMVSVGIGEGETPDPFG